MIMNKQFLNVSKVFREKTREIDLYEFSLLSRKYDEIFYKLYHADIWNTFYIVVLILIDFRFVALDYFCVYIYIDFL